MPPVDWRSWCKNAGDVEVQGEVAMLTLAEGRRHRIRVSATDGTYELKAVVAGAAAIEQVPKVELRAWRRNRSSQLVGFRLDANRRLVAEAWVPKAGVTGEEFLARLRHVAAEADLFEYQLTGADRQ